MAQVPGFNPAMQAQQAQMAQQAMMQHSMLMASMRAAARAQALKRSLQVKQTLDARPQGQPSVQPLAEPTKEVWRSPKLAEEQIPLPMDGVLVGVLGKEGDGDLRVTGFDEMSGKPRWEFKVGYGLVTPLMPYEDTVLLVTGEYEVILLEAATGKVRMRFPLKGDDLFPPAGQKRPRCMFPMVDGHLLLLAIKGMKMPDAPGLLLAADLAEGKRTWMAPLPEAPDLDPQVAGSLAITGANGQVRAFQLSDGKAAWSADLGHKKALGGCLITDSCIAVAGNGQITGLDATTGTKTWQQPYKGDLLVASEAGRFFYLETRGVFSKTVWLVGLDPATGLKAWEAKNTYGELPWIADKRVVVADDDGLKAFDASTGKAQWTLALPNPPIFPIQATEDRLYVVYKHYQLPNIAAIDLNIGKARWVHIQSGDTPLDGMLLVGVNELYYPAPKGVAICLR